ncbi:MAG: hypothetical protein Q8830_03760, partial [Candidatus Phytoplasma australasiaticum]|nr:hypothetical protein [Candidatus Phytoplasma australasiaticum]
TINKILLYLFACFMGLFALIQQISFFLIQKAINLVPDNDFIDHQHLRILVDFQLVPILKVFASRVKGRHVYLKFKEVVCIHVLCIIKRIKTLNKGKQLRCLWDLGS